MTRLSVYFVWRNKIFYPAGNGYRNTPNLKTAKYHKINQPRNWKNSSLMLKQ